MVRSTMQATTVSSMSEGAVVEATEVEDWFDEESEEEEEPLPSPSPDPAAKYAESQLRVVRETKDYQLDYLQHAFQPGRELINISPAYQRRLRWNNKRKSLLIESFLDHGVIHVWRSTRRDGDTKTPRSRRSLVLPKRAIDVLTAHGKRQAVERLAAGEAWQDANLVFCHEDGRQYSSDALNWRFSRMTRRAGIGHWHAHEGRHTAVSIMSSNGVPIQDISDTVGHKSTHVTETVYRHVIVPAIRGGATVMDSIFDSVADDASEQRKKTASA
jgi:hypothetical protein